MGDGRAFVFFVGTNLTVEVAGGERNAEDCQLVGEARPGGNIL